MAKRKARFSGSADEHRGSAAYHVREIKRLVRVLRSEMKDPPDCESAARIALRLSEQSGIYHSEKVHANLHRTTYGGEGVRALLNRFVSKCVVKPKSAAAARKMRAVWRRAF